jgi:centrin-1
MMTARISDSDNREDIAKVFKLFDSNESGHINISDLQRVARELGESLSAAELKEMIDRADLDGDGVISFEEFYNIMTKKNFD